MLQTDIQKKQHAVGRLQFLATHRPRLTVRHVSIQTADHIGHPTIFFDHGAPVRGGLAVVNVGGSAATIVETRYRIFFTRSGLPVQAPYDTDYRTDLLLPDQICAVGESGATPIADTIVMDDPLPFKGTIELHRFNREGWGRLRHGPDSLSR